MAKRRIHYITFRQLVEDTLSLVGKVPSHVTAVAGVPRSGMCPASIIASSLHLPLAAAGWHGLTKIGHGRRLQSDAAGGTLLIVDDSALRGDSLARAVKATGLPRERLVTAVVYAHPWCLRHSSVGIDLFQQALPSPRFFEWNLLNHQVAGHMMCDIDGVICQEPAAPDDDSEAYATALRSAAPLHLPRRGKIHSLVTHRLERWRDITRDWLQQYGVKYEHLIMAPQATAAQRRIELRPYGRWKGSLFQQSHCRFFIESSRRQAREIYRTSRKPVLCMEDGMVFQ